MSRTSDCDFCCSFSQSRLKCLVFLAVIEILKEIFVSMQIFCLQFHITLLPLYFTERKTERPIMQVGTLCFVVWSENKHRYFGVVKHIFNGEGSSIGV